MLSRETLGQSVNDEKKRRKTKGRVPRAYERFFEGYTTRFISGKHGKKSRVKRVYTGDYYCCAMPDIRRRAVKLTYVLLLAISVYFYAAAALLNIHSNTVWYGVLPQAALIAAFGWSGAGIVNLLLGRKLLTVHEYKTSSGFIKKGTAMAFVCAVLAAAAVLADVLLLGGAGNSLAAAADGSGSFMTGDIGSSLAALAGFAASALCIGILGCIERKIIYEKIPAQEK